MIKKTSEARPLSAKVVNVNNNSQTDAYSCKYINQCNTYSTSETFTGKYWIGGEPIYRKCFSGTLETSANNTFMTQIPDIKIPIRQYGCVYASLTGYRMPFPVYVSSTNNINCAVDNRNIPYIGYSDDKKGQYYIYVVEYIKTS